MNARLHKEFPQHHILQAQWFPSVIPDGGRKQGDVAFDSHLLRHSEFEAILCSTRPMSQPNKKNKLKKEQKKIKSFICYLSTIHIGLYLVSVDSLILPVFTAITTDFYSKNRKKASFLLTYTSFPPNTITKHRPSKKDYFFYLWFQGFYSKTNGAHCFSELSQNETPGQGQVVEESCKIIMVYSF